MDHPFLTPYEQGPEPIPSAPARPPTPVPPTNTGGGSGWGGVGTVLKAVLCAAVIGGGIAAAWAVADQFDPVPEATIPPDETAARPPADPVIPTPDGPAAPPADPKPDLFAEQAQVDREIAELVETLTRGHPGAAARLGQVRAVLGDGRFLRDVRGCLVRAGVDRPLTADEWARVVALQNRQELVQARVAAQK